MTDNSTANNIQTETAGHDESSERKATDGGEKMDTQERTHGDEPVSTTELAALEQYTTSLNSIDPLDPVSPSDTISHQFADGQIIALGEATHGTREFFQFKHKLLRFLVVEQGVRVFAMEANFPETLAINEYVLHGTGDPKEALESIYFWTWNVESVLTMVEWMREFNEDRPLGDRVRFYGFDAQYTTGAVSRLESYLESVDATLPDGIRDDLSLVDDGGTNPDQDEETERRLEAGERVVPRLRGHLDSHREEYISHRDERSWELAKQHVALIEQATEYRRARSEYDGGFGENVTEPEVEALEQLLTIRDRAMADNVDWLLDFEEREQIVIWAHDAHINREKHLVRGAGAVAKPMGGFLADRHGEAYVPVGFSFGRGSFQAISQVDEVDGEPTHELQGQTLQSPVSGTLDATLDLLDIDVGLVNIRDAREDGTLQELLNEPQSHFSVGATYAPGKLEDYLTEYVYGEAFDLLCFVAETTRARPVSADIPE